MRLTVKHTTRYSFETPVQFALQQVRKTPKSTAMQWVVNWNTRVTGGRKELSFTDHHRNLVELLSYNRDATELEVISEGDVELNDTQGVLGQHNGPAPLWLYKRATPLTEPKSALKALARRVSGATALDTLHNLSAEIGAEVTYRVGASEPDWSAEQALAAGEGVCQDHTHIFLACARVLGHPARYVSGYLMLNDRQVQDAMHAWAEAYVENLGWVGFDVSNGISPDTRYIRVATGLDYTDAAPVLGRRLGGGAEALDVQITVAQQ